MNQVQVFNFKDSKVRTVSQDGNPWWVAKDVCEVLEIAKTTQAIQGLDGDEKLMATIQASGQNRNMWIINEPGLYSLILRSRKPEAKAFKRWIVHEVIPAIRKTGIYVNTDPKAFAEIDELTKAAQLANFLRDQAEVLSSDVNQAIQAHVLELLTGKADHSNAGSSPVVVLPKKQRPVGFSVKEIAAIAGVSFQKASSVARKNGIRCEPYGSWHDYLYNGRIERAFIYNRKGKDALLGLLDVHNLGSS